MKIIEEALNGILVFEPLIFKDNRGVFFESWNNKVFHSLGINFDFVQDNQSVSSKNVVRGLHYQNPPYEQGKLVRVTRGSVIDVVVDIRPHSPTFKHHFKMELSEHNMRMMWIPPGFAHGFVSLQDNTVFLYKCTNYYHQPSEKGIIYNDPELQIDWGISSAVVSDKDLKLPRLSEIIFSG
jgi:dTDP-4-dehydrorhamnose 3,5-epimerase